MRKLHILELGVASLMIVSCAATSYGVDPKAVPSVANTYDFTVYFNAFTTDAHIDRDLEAQVRNFKTKNGYTAHAVENRDCNRMTGKCTIRVHFTR